MTFKKGDVLKYVGGGTSASMGYVCMNWTGMIRTGERVLCLGIQEHRKADYLGKTADGWVKIYCIKLLYNGKIHQTTFESSIDKLMKGWKKIN